MDLSNNGVQAPNTLIFCPAYSYIEMVKFWAQGLDTFESENRIKCHIWFYKKKNSASVLVVTRVH